MSGRAKGWWEAGKGIASHSYHWLPCLWLTPTENPRQGAVQLLSDWADPVIRFCKDILPLLIHSPGWEGRCSLEPPFYILVYLMHCLGFLVLSQFFSLNQFCTCYQGTYVVKHVVGLAPSVFTFSSHADSDIQSAARNSRNIYTTGTDKLYKSSYFCLRESAGKYLYLCWGTGYESKENSDISHMPLKDCLVQWCQSWDKV